MCLTSDGMVERVTFDYVDPILTQAFKSNLLKPQIPKLHVQEGPRHQKDVEFPPTSLQSSSLQNHAERFKTWPMASHHYDPLCHIVPFKTIISISIL